MQCRHTNDDYILTLILCNDCVLERESFSGWYEHKVIEP